MENSNVATILGTRPEIIELSMFIEEKCKHAKNNIKIDTNQHYDVNVDMIFMEELEIRRPNGLRKLKAVNAHWWIQDRGPLNRREPACCATRG